MTTGEYIDSLLDELEAIKDERDLYEHEAETLLKVIVEAIDSPSYINPWKVFGYLKAVYPNLYEKTLAKYEA